MGSLMETLEQCLLSCNSKLLDAKIFCETLPTAHHFLSELVENITKAVSADDKIQSMDNTKQQLVMCHGLLDFWQKCVEHVLKLRNVAVNDVKSLPEHVLEVVKLVFEHCKASPRMYGDLLDALSKELTNLFHKASTIFKLFLATLEGVIVFDTDAESETELLVKVISIIGSIATITSEMDLGTFVRTNKAFCNLAVSHQSEIKKVSSRSVTSHLGQLSKHVASTLSTLKSLHDGIDERTIRATGSLLKILNKIFEAYYSCLDSEELISVFELLLHMHRCSPPCLKASQVEERAIDLMNVHVSLGIEPLMSIIFKSTHFKQAYFEYGRRSDIDKLGYHFLTLGIMKKLINMPYEHHCEWTFGADSILDVALSNINDLQEEICVGELRLPGVHEVGERPRHVTLYEATLVPICSLISQVPTSGFYAVELLLLKHLLSNQFWCSLLSADIWCFIGRLGSSDLCVSHIKYLSKVYSSLAKRQNCFELVVLENLIGRLYALLSEEAKHCVVVDVTDLDAQSWIPIARLLPAKTRSFLGKRFAFTLNEISNVFLELYERPTVQTWNRLVQLLSIMGRIDHIEEKRSVDAFAKMWSTVANTIENFESRHMDVLSDFVTVLLNAVQPGHVEDDVFIRILEAVLKSFLWFPPHLKASAAHCLRNTATCFDECAPKIADLLSELNCRLLEDENPWVRQEAVEAFDYFAHTCPNERLIERMAISMRNNSSISEFLPAYLSRSQYYELRDYKDMQHYLRQLSEGYVRHVCRRYEDSQRVEKLARIDASGETALSHLDERVLRICEELDDVVKSEGIVSEFALRRLKDVYQKVLDLKC